MNENIPTRLLTGTITLINARHKITCTFKLQIADRKRTAHLVTRYVRQHVAPAKDEKLMKFVFLDLSLSRWEEIVMDKRKRPEQ